MESLQRFFKSPVKLAALYVAASVFIGPAILSLGWGLFTSGGGDYCDSVYDVPGGRALAAHQFHKAQLFQVAASGAMIVLGLLLAGWLIAHALKDKKHSLKYMLLLLGIGLMVLGYIVAMSFSGKGGQTC